MNLIGTVLLFLSFQATSSNVRIVKELDGTTAVCVDKISLFRSFASGAWQLSGPCPDWDTGRPAAVVIIEKPLFVTIGFTLTSLGFLLQFLSLPSPKTIAQMHKELKELEKAEKLKRKITQLGG
jgi:hypothetical protein